VQLAQRGIRARGICSIGTRPFGDHMDTRTPCFAQVAVRDPVATAQRHALGDDHITVMSGEMEERDGTMVMKDPANAVDGIQVPEVDRSK